MPKARVSNEDFVVAYATANDLDEVTKTTKMSRAAIWARVKFLRSKGVNFPKLNRDAVLDDLAIARLNSLIIKHDIRREK